MVAAACIRHELRIKCAGTADCSGVLLNYTSTILNRHSFLQPTESDAHDVCTSYCGRRGRPAGPSRPGTRRPPRRTPGALARRHGDPEWTDAEDRRRPVHPPRRDRLGQSGQPGPGRLRHPGGHRDGNRRRGRTRPAPGHAQADLDPGRHRQRARRLLPGWPVHLLPHAARRRIPAQAAAADATGALPVREPGPEDRRAGRHRAGRHPEHSPWRTTPEPGGDRARQRSRDARRGDRRHQPYNVMADHLARQGIAVLRYDKRGNGLSSGDFAQVTTEGLVADLAAIMKAMNARKDFGQIGMVGLSEGPGIAAAVAARHPADVDFIVSLAGVGLSGHELILLQDHLLARDNGAQPQEMERLMAYVRDFYAAILANPEPQARVAALKAVQAGLSPEEQAMIEKYGLNYGSLSIEEAEKPHLRTLMLARPQDDWRKVRVPVLALNGSLDHQVPAKENLAGIVGALKAGGNHKVESAALPSLNHLFQTARTGATSEYATIDETIAPAVLERIAAFVKKQK
ncbi:MAG: alpha/beta hydrolase family protein [Janthinobacterium lividum]